jgi:hypothetical protein
VATAPIPRVFPSTGWKTIALDRITFEMPDHRKEAAFYIALMGWTLRSDNGHEAVLDIGDWGSAVFRSVPEEQTARVVSFCFVVEPWTASRIRSELQKRGLTAVADNDGTGFESFHVKDPDGWDLQVSNRRRTTKARELAPNEKLSTQAPFESTGWRTVWLDHFSYNAANYKKSASSIQACWVGRRRTMREVSMS